MQQGVHKKMSYARVNIFKAPGEFDRPLTYRIPQSMTEEILVGRGVRVVLRDRKARGIVVGMDRDPVIGTRILDIEEVIPELSLEPAVISLAQKISDYYKCSLLRALRLFVPKVLWQGTGKRLLRQVEKADYQPVDMRKFPLVPLEHELSRQQQEAVRMLDVETRPILLHGVTGSGKTEIYLRAILKTVNEGKQAILLVPEIALTPQMISYFEQYFGSHMALFHSRLSDGEKLHEWFKVKSGYAPLVIGSRSAIFAPVKMPGIIIVDEEHEWTYKQESAPYYETHRVAEMIRESTGCRLIFGTATPRLETYYKTEEGEYAKIRLADRVNQSALPAIQVVDLREEFRMRNFSIFSRPLYTAIQDRLNKKEQVILFVNQRGMARALLCRDCGKSLECPRCEVSMTLHGGSFGTPQHLLCHYCSCRSPLPVQCPQCGSVNIRHAGVGTERVEEELFRHFPQARTVRADKDTTSDKLGFSPIYEAFKNCQYDILVGTQMIAKGLDFPGVTLIGVMLADIGLHVPDFRSHERLFQLITQVSGRAGRGDSKGQVILQTYNPGHPAIRLAASYAYEEFAKNELAFRKRLDYPPFGHLVKFVITGTDPGKLSEHVRLEKEVLEDILKVNGLKATLITAPALIPKIGETYYYHLLIKSPEPSGIFEYWQPPKGWRADVDPVHTT